MTPDLWCGIPVYNNAATIFDVARKSRELIDHVVVLDDGSTDADLTDLLKPLDVIVLRHPKNLGKGQALLTLFRYAADRGAEYLITLDGDGQHFPEDLPRFIPYLSPDTILIGYRQQVTGEMPRSSRFGREFSDFWVCVEAGDNARDTQSGFRVYPLDAILQLQLASRFYNFEMEIITKALWAGMRIGSVPIQVWYPPADQRVSSFDPFRDNLRISLLHTKLILRQLLPIPHRQLTLQHPSENKFVTMLRENSSPLGLAASAGLSILMGIVLWPFGMFAVAYVAWRLHLNKVVAAVALVLCLPKLVPKACVLAGRNFVSSSHSRWQWIVGSHVIALPLAMIVGSIVYMIARYSEKQSRGVSPRSEPQAGATHPGSAGNEV